MAPRLHQQPQPLRGAEHAQAHPPHLSTAIRSRLGYWDQAMQILLGYTGNGNTVCQQGVAVDDALAFAKKSAPALPRQSQTRSTHLRDR